MAMQPQLENSRKSSQPFPPLGLEIQRNFERKEESKRESCSKVWSDTWQDLVIGC